MKHLHLHNQLVSIYEKQSSNHIYSLIKEISLDKVKDLALYLFSTEPN